MERLVSIPYCALNRRSCSSIAGTRPWSSSAVGRSWRASWRSSPIAWFARLLVSASSSLQPRRSDLRERLEPQQDRGERLVDLVVEVARDALALLLLGAQLKPAGAPALGLDPLEQLGEGVREPLDLLHRLLGGLERGRVARVDRLDLADQLVQRAEPPLQHQDVQQQREDDRHREQREREPLVVEVQVQARRRARGEQRRHDQQEVGGDDLAAEGFPLFHRLSQVLRTLRRRKMGFRPHIGKCAGNRH